MLGMRTSRRAMAAFVTPPCTRMSSLRLPDQPYSGHRHAPLVTAIAGLVLGGLPCHNSDPRYERPSISTAAWPRTGRYETAFQMLHKLRAAMVRPDQDGIGGEWPVELDETWVGGATQGEGRGRHHKTLVVGAVEVRPRAKAPGPDPNITTGQAKTKHSGGHGRS